MMKLLTNFVLRAGAMVPTYLALALVMGLAASQSATPQLVTFNSEDSLSDVIFLIDATSQYRQGLPPPPLPPQAAPGVTTTSALAVVSTPQLGQQCFGIIRELLCCVFTAERLM